VESSQAAWAHHEGQGAALGSGKLDVLGRLGVLVRTTGWFCFLYLP